MFQIQNCHNGEDWQDIPGCRLPTKTEAVHAALCLSADAMRFGMTRVLDSNGHPVATYGAGEGKQYVEHCEKELKVKGQFYNTIMGSPWEPPVKFEIPEGARSPAFDNIIRKYGPKPVKPIKLREHKYTSFRISEPDLYDTAHDYPSGAQYPGEREFLLRTSARPRSSFQDLVGDYFRPVFLRHLWFTYYA